MTAAVCYLLFALSAFNLLDQDSIRAGILVLLGGIPVSIGCYQLVRLTQRAALRLRQQQPAVWSFLSAMAPFLNLFLCMVAAFAILFLLFIGPGIRDLQF